MKDLAIRNTHSSVVTIDGEKAYDIHGNLVQLDMVKVSTELTRLNTQFQNSEYQRKRATEYPSIGDQLDALFHAGVFPSDMADKIQAIKDKYPKV